MKVLVNELVLFVWQNGQRDVFSPDKGWKQRMYKAKNSLRNFFSSEKSLDGLKKDDYANGYSSLFRYPTYRADFKGDIVELLEKDISPHFKSVSFGVNLASLYDYVRMPAKYESIARDHMKSLVGKTIDIDGSTGYTLTSGPVKIYMPYIKLLRKDLGIEI